MPSTYMNLTNKLLRRLNEVQITQSDFPSVQGIQATAKDCIFDSVQEINNDNADWPFNAVQHTQNLVAGVEEYAWPSNFTLADWSSFQLQADDTLGVKTKRLQLLNREQWYEIFKDRDDDSGTAGIRRPEYVTPSHGQGFAVTPSPDQAYPIQYRYYRDPPVIEAYDSEVSIPSKYDYVILLGALYHLNLFKENAEAAASSKAEFKNGIAVMKKNLLPNDQFVYSAPYNLGGNSRQYNKSFFTGV